jgi:hypothetical protein
MSLLNGNFTQHSVVEAAVVRVPSAMVLVHAVRIARIDVAVEGTATVLLGKQFFDFPAVLLGTDRELEIFLGDGVPVLVDHHDGEEIADAGKEETVEVVLHSITDRLGENVKDDLADDEEDGPESNISKWPSILQCSKDEQDLHNNIHDQTNSIDDIQHHEHAGGTSWTEPGPILECGERDKTSDNKHGCGAAAQKPDGKSGAIFINLETNKAVDQETHAERRDETSLHSGEVRVRSTARWNNTGIEKEGSDSQSHIDIEKGNDFLATYWDHQRLADGLHHANQLFLFQRRHSEGGR